MSIKLEDVQQTAIYIPYDGDESDDDAEPTLSSAHLENDLENGPRLRFDAYKAAWTRCLDRVKFIIAQLYRPVISDVMNRLNDIHSDVLPGLPFPELPVITIADLSGGSRFLDHLSSRLEPEDDDDEAPITLVNHLYPSDCLNITSAMRKLIGGFVERDTTAPRRRPAVSLAPYDLGLLQAWYDAVEDPSPTLVVLLHEFEQCDANIVQDMFYICSLQIDRLPLTFILSLSTPSPSTYLQASLTRSTLALIRAYHFAVPSGPEVLNAVLLNTFFDPAFDLLLLPGPTLLEFVENHYTTHNPSLDALVTILQVTHLKHYTTDMFSLLSSTTPPISSSPTPSELLFLEALLARLHASGASKKNAGEWRAQSRSSDILLQAVDSARETFPRHARRTKLGFNLLNIVTAFLRGSTNDKLLDRWEGVVGMSKILDGGGVGGLADLLRKIPSTDLVDTLLAKLHGYFQSMLHGIRSAESKARLQIIAFRSAPVPPSADEIADWLENYLAELLQTARGFNAALECVVHRTNALPIRGIFSFFAFLQIKIKVNTNQLINPALRPSIISGLSFPHFFTGHENAQDENESEENLQELPDSSILFKGYTKAGKMINVYDWFDHFRMVLEAQRQDELAKTTQPQTPTKGKEKGKKVEPKDDEKWNLGVQARFMRSLHELDYLGFIKHTSRGGGGRKGEYVLRTVLGVLD